MTTWSKKATETLSNRMEFLMIWYNTAVQNNNIWAAKTAMSHYNSLKYELRRHNTVNQRTSV